VLLSVADSGMCLCMLNQIQSVDAVKCEVGSILYKLQVIVTSCNMQSYFFGYTCS
jgi:hypothetical protein